jgi:photosystem II stability/assembly factor-like uncharacterized protein
MAKVGHVDVGTGDLLLLLGTAKGVFLLRSPAGNRADWQLAGPYCPGHKIYALALDQRKGRHRLWASRFNNHWGTVLAHSDDFGRDWHVPEDPNIKFPDGSGDALKQIWEVKLGPPGQDDVLYAGVEPAALFKSTDAGESWHLVRGLYDHPHRKQWHPGGGGLCLHTIVPDPANPQRMYVAISTGGVYRSEDGGESWRPRNKGVSAVYMPGDPPEFGQCVHRIVMHPSNPNRLFLQNHWGLFRTDDGAESWVDIGKDFPWTFGFPMAVHPRQPETVYILPVESDQFRCTPEGKLRVWRSNDAGNSWHELSRGLPQENALETVLRHGMDTDPLTPAGVYFGTESGKVYGSADDGDSWRLLQEGLPPVLCVKAVVIANS